ncbi:hypothetical protein GCM10023201_52590 [Actinomycetospora corticicola]|uniref:Type IV pilus biogenesis protein CpaD/CtpE n=1 Tax=Actinomycetospora corticicola TaxID=663602 RepID=A0A7Y9J7J6_9PSEU|nr:hypothetical protein [Actinomycetospora corticicola]NYD37479.1 type IV pilus biogenesis protein CpaD/CtpE [Actinomycetospora corticicola]
MAPDLDLLRLHALAVPGVACLADHRDGLAPSGHPTTRAALRVHERHVEVDIVLAAGHSILTTSAALRAAIAPLLAERAVHITVTHVEGDPTAPTTTLVFRHRGAVPPDPDRDEDAPPPE